MDPEAILAAIEQQRDSDAEPREEQERVSYLGVLSRRRKSTDFRSSSCARSRASATCGASPARRPASRGSSICAARFCARSTCARFSGCRRRPRRESPFLVALRGFGDPLGLIVDSIADIYAVSPSDIEAPPATWPAERAACFIGTARVPAGLMGLLDLARVTKV